MNSFLCPYCQAQLNVHGFLVLSAHCESGEKGIVLLSDKLGDYTVHFSENLKLNIKEGDKINMHCPACQHSLAYKQNANLARLIKIGDSGKEHTIIFSTVFGEQSTYEISEERTMSFGEHAVRYMDPDWYRRI